MKHRELNSVLTALIKKTAVAQATALNNALLISGILAVLQDKLNIDVDKLLKEVQTSENFQALQAQYEELLKISEHIASEHIAEQLSNENHSKN